MSTMDEATKAIADGLSVRVRRTATGFVASWIPHPIPDVANAPSVSTESVLTIDFDQARELVHKILKKDPHVREDPDFVELAKVLGVWFEPSTP